MKDKLALFWRVYWILPASLGLLFNTLWHSPQVWSMLGWGLVTGFLVVGAILFGERTEMMTKPMKIPRMCTCNHSINWHGQQGSCQFPKCDCAEFKDK